MRNGRIAVLRRVVLCAFAVCWGTAYAQFPDHLPDPPVVDYLIYVTLDPAEKTLTGHETIRYTNHSPDTIPDLQFHLYLNAFKNERTTFWRESGGRSRSYKASKDGWGYADLNALRVNGLDHEYLMRHIRPDDGNPHDETVLRVPLEEPIEPGETAVIDIEFEAKLPKIFARTGYHGDYFLVAQWFPKLGVWETAGQRGREEAGWNCHQFHGNSEFYADFGRYEVHITVPQDFVVGATGEMTKETVENQRKTLTYEAEPVIDFAFTASPDFVVEERVFDPDEWISEEELQAVMNRFGIDRSEAELRPVDMTLLLYPEKRHLADRMFKALGNAIKYFGLWYDRYPYSGITMVDPPWGAEGSGGMEYPTFITTWSSRRVPEFIISPWTDLYGPEEVTVHEFGHQYWQSMVATNEFEEPWMDEGINSYTTGLVMDQVYGAARIYEAINDVPLPVGDWLGIEPVDHTTMARMYLIEEHGSDQLVRAAWRYLDRGSYVLNAYDKSELVLRQLGKELGEDVMAQVMRTYFQRWKFKHPTTADFIAVAEEVSGKDLDWFFDSFFFHPGYVDYTVGKVESDVIGDEQGIFDGDTGRVTRTEADAKRFLDDLDEEQATYRTVVEILNDGNVPYPVDIRFEFSNDETVEETWDGAYRWTRYEFERPGKLQRVAIDPDETLVIEVNRTNNTHDVKPEKKAKWWWAVRLTVIVQNALQSLVTAAS